MVFDYSAKVGINCESRKKVEGKIAVLAIYFINQDFLIIPDCLEEIPEQ